MRRIIFTLLIVTTLSACSKEDNSNLDENLPEATLIGRWNFVGFDGAVLYEFTDSKRFTFYSDDGTFISLEELLVSGGGLASGNPYWYEGDKVSIDLHFGNILTLTPEFVCDNYVVNWLRDDGSIHHVLYREDYIYDSCNQ